jgi:RND family efflux transporter MFP subunit
MNARTRLAGAGLGALAAVAVIGAACTPLTSTNGSTIVSVPATAAERGEIQQTLSLSGDVRAQDQITVLPKASGRVEDVLVDVGSAVHAGDTIARLESDDPDLAVLQARAALSAAEAKLSTVEAGGKADDVTAAQETLAQQQAKLASLQAEGRPEDIAVAQAALAAQQAKLNLMLSGGRAEAVAQAQSGLDAAQQKLALVQQGATDDVRQAAVSAVNVDKAQVASAEAAYAALGGTSAADLQSLQNAVDTLNAQVAAAQSVINSTNAALASQTGASAADVQAAQTAYDQAQASLNTAQAALNQANNPTQASIAQAQAALAQAQAQQSAAEANQTALEQKVAGACAPVPAGQQMNERAGADGSLTGTITTIAAGPNGTACDAAKSAAGAAVDSGNAVVEAAQGQLDQLKRGGAPAQQVALQAQVTSAQALVKATKARLDALTNGGVHAQRAQLQSQHDQAQSQLVAAQDQLNVAQARLQAAQNGTLDAQRKAAQAQVDAAREKLTADQSHLEQLVAGPQPEEVQAAQDAVDQANAQVALAQQPVTQQDIAAQQAAVESAKQQLAKAQTPYTTADIQQQQHVVAAAAAQLDKAQNPYTDQDLATAQAGVDQAQVALEQAQLGVRETQVTAPVDGVVFDRQVSPGALVGPTSPIITLIPPQLEVDVNVDEAQLGNVQPGQAVQVTVPAYANQPFAGTVSAVAPAVDQKTRTSAVHIQPLDPQGKLKPGMLATVSVAVADKQDALLLPRAAVSTSGTLSPNTQTTIVTIDPSGHAQHVPIQIGLATDSMVEVTRGLSDGQLVAIGNTGGVTDGEIVQANVQAPVALEAENNQ